MNYTFMIAIVIIGILFLLAGMMSQVGVEGFFSNMGTNTACAFAYVVIFIMILMGCSSYSELYKLFSSVCGGIPYVSQILDHGSFAMVWKQSPLEGAQGFLDTVLVSFILDLLISFFGVFSGKKGIRKFQFVAIFSSVILSLAVTLIIVNLLIKPSSAYKLATAILGAVISLISLGSIPVAIITMMKKNFAPSIVAIAMLYGFFNTKIMKNFRGAFFKSLVITFGLLVFETYFGSLVNGLNILTMIISSFLPCIIMIVAIGIMTWSVIKPTKF